MLSVTPSTRVLYKRHARKNRNPKLASTGYNLYTNYPWVACRFVNISSPTNYPMTHYTNTEVVSANVRKSYVGYSHWDKIPSKFNRPTIFVRSCTTHDTATGICYQQWHKSRLITSKYNKTNNPSSTQICR